MWTPDGNKCFGTYPGCIPVILTFEQAEAIQLRLRVEETSDLLRRGASALEAAVYFAPPSPPPEYDSLGLRTNTRENRARDRLQRDRALSVHRITAIYPSYRPPIDYKSSTGRVSRKIRVPVDKFPGYNFLGLILGPRGETHKELERRSNCKVYIRGRGSQLDGKPPNKEDEDEDLHVRVEGDSEEKLDAAEALVRQLLVPVSDENNEHKQLQLRRLAEFNGTLREEMPWALRLADRPKDTRGAKRVRVGDVVCGSCGSPAHATRDCPHHEDDEETKRAREKEYRDFLVSIGQARADSDRTEREEAAALAAEALARCTTEQVAMLDEILDDFFAKERDSAPPMPIEMN